jgi:PAS domain-containing protein
MEYFALAGVVVGFLAFAAAFALLLFTPFKAETGASRVMRFLLLLIFLLHVVSSAMLFLSEADMEEVFGPEVQPIVAALEDNIETLFPLLAAGVAFAAFSAQQYQEVLLGQKALARSHDLMLDIVDATPAGIVFLDPSGQITFANDAAEEVLDLVEQPGTGTLINAVWTLEGTQDYPPGSLAPLVRGEAYDGIPVTLSWPSGLSVDLRVSGRPLQDARNDIGGVVLTFDRPTGPPVQGAAT